MVVSLSIMRYFRTSGILHKYRAFEEQESSLWIMRPKETTSPKDKTEKERIRNLFTNLRHQNVDSNKQNRFSLSIMRIEKCMGENKYRVITTVRNPKKP